MVSSVMQVFIHPSDVSASSSKSATLFNRFPRNSSRQMAVFSSWRGTAHQRPSKTFSNTLLSTEWPEFPYWPDGQMSAFWAFRKLVRQYARKVKTQLRSFSFGNESSIKVWKAGHSAVGT